MYNCIEKDFVLGKSNYWLIFSSINFQLVETTDSFLLASNWYYKAKIKVISYKIQRHD